MSTTTGTLKDINNNDFLPVTDVSLVSGLEDISTIRSGAASGATSYQKPASGIPETDLASAVTSKLNSTEIFWATYGTTTATEIIAAVEAGKVVFCLYNEHLYTLSDIRENNPIYFSTFISSQVRPYLTVNRTTNVWGASSITHETVSNKKTTIVGNETSDTYYPTTKAVADAIAALPEPMVFQGTIGTSGTISTVPNSPSEGDTYKIIEGGQALTFSGITDTIKVGDTVIYKNSTIGWILIPSGDEPSGTVTSVTAGDGLNTTNNDTDVDGGTISSSGTLYLTKSGVSTGTYKSVTVDKYGRVTDGSNPTTLSGYGITDAIDTSSTNQTKTGDLTAGKFVTNGGTSSQFVKGDGTLDNSAYLTSHQDISNKADKVDNATSGNLAALDSNGNLTDSGINEVDVQIVPSTYTEGNLMSFDGGGYIGDSGISSNNVVLKSSTSGLLKNDGTIDTTEYGSLASILIPNFDEMTPVRTIELDIAATTYYKLFTRSNSGISATMSEVNDILLFRITCTGTNIYAQYDFFVKFKSALTYPLVVVNCNTLSATAATTGLQTIRFQYPKGLDNGYDWLCDIKAYNNTARHIKVEIFATTENITWFDTLVATNYNSTYQSDGSLSLYDRRGIAINGTVYTNAQTAGTASYVTAYHSKFINGSIIRAGEALVTYNLCYVNNGYAYKISNKDISIDPDYGINMSGTNYSTYSYMAYMHFRSQTGCTFAVDTALTYDPFLIGNKVYLRCRLLGDKIYSDGHLSTKIAPGYTWYFLGTVQTTSVISICTFGSMFITLDENGMISHINGKPTQAALMNGNYKKYFYNTSLSNVNSVAKLNYVEGKSLVFNQIVNNVADSTDGWVKYGNKTTISAANGVLSAYNTTGEAYFGITTTSTNASVVIGHLYFCSIYAKATKTMNVYAPYISTTYITIQQKLIDPQPLSTEWRRFTCLVLGKGNGNPFFGMRNYNAAVGEATIYVKNAMMIDLTKMFGPGNEPQDMEMLMEMFPLDYYNYNIDGTLITGSQTGFTSKNSSDNTITSLSIPITTLTGTLEGSSTSEVMFPNGLNGIGDIKDEVDFKTGKAIKRVGAVNLGMLNWYYSSGIFYTDILDYLPHVLASEYSLIICSKYITCKDNELSSNNKVISLNQNPRIRVRDTSYSSNTDFSESIDGEILLYELENPIEYTLDTIPTVEYETELGGTEQWLPSNTSVPTVAPISCVSSYYSNSAIPTSQLATVAISGSYDDLEDKPTIPAAQVNSDWNASSGVAQILNKPTIPTIPTNVSAFTNDAGYLTQHQDISGKADKTIVASSMPSEGFLPNVVYNLGTLSGNTSFTMAAATDNTIANIWCWTFTTPSTAPTITWPAGITGWSGGAAPAINASKCYEVTVMNGLATIIES